MSNKEKILFSLIGRWNPDYDRPSFERMGRNSSGGSKAGVLADKVMKTVSHKNQRKILNSSEDEMMFVYIVSGDFLYLCVAGTDFPKRICLNFLEDLEERFLERRPGNPSGLIKKQMKFFNDIDNDQIRKASRKVDEIKGIMTKNIDSIIGRGEALEEIQERAEGLEDTAFVFERKAKTLNYRMIMQVVIISGVICMLLCLCCFVFLIILYCVICLGLVEHKSLNPKTCFS